MTWTDDTPLWPPDEYEGRRRREPEPEPEPEPESVVEPAPFSLRRKAARRGAILLAVAVGLAAAAIGLQFIVGRQPPTVPDTYGSHPSAGQVGLLPVDTDVPGVPSTDVTSASATPRASTPRAVASAAGSASPAPPATTQPVVAGPPALLLDNFDGSPAWTTNNLGINDVGEATETSVFFAVAHSGGALTLTYHDDGWFGSDVLRPVSEYTYLVIRIRGNNGGEQSHIRLTLGGAQRMLSALTLADGTHPTIGTSYQDIRIPMVANGINRAQPGELQLDFWHGGYGTVGIDEIRFE